MMTKKAKQEEKGQKEGRGEVVIREWKEVRTM